MSTITDNNSQKPVKQRASTRREADQLTPRARIEHFGFDGILDSIRAGKSQSEIAKSLGVHCATLTRFLREDDERARRTDRAMADSAEAWLDRGLEAIEEARGGDTAEVQRVRIFAQECARRAAIRNPRYSERNQIELSGPDGRPVQIQPVAVSIYLPSNGRIQRDIAGSVITANNEES